MLLAGVVLAGGAIVGGSVATVATSPDGGPGTRRSEPVTPTAPPEPGKPPRIGPWKGGAPPPDLTPVELEDGRTGYLRLHDLGKPSSELKQRRVNQRTTETLITVYAEDGQTPIGEFVVGTSTVG